MSTPMQTQPEGAFVTATVTGAVSPGAEMTNGHSVSHGVAVVCEDGR